MRIGARWTWAALALLGLLGACGTSPSSGSSFDAGCLENEPISGAVCVGIDDAGCTSNEATCCRGVPTCAFGMTLEWRADAGLGECTSLNIAGCLAK